MAASRRHRHRRRVTGLIPGLFRLAWSGLRWFIRHPQTLVVAGAVAALGWALWGYVQRSDAFRIARVTFPLESPLTLRDPLLGKNLLAVDIQALSEELKRQQPSLKEVRVVRQLPNTL